MFVNLKEGQLDELLHIPEPWYIREVEFSLEAKQLDVYVKFRKRALFSCTKCGEPNQPVRDIANHDRTWRHLNFFEYPCYIHAELPRTNCGECNSITRVHVPWALDKPKHYFTLLFDALIIKLAKHMPMNAVSRLLGEHDTRLWRILHHYVDNAIAAQDLSYVTKISTDETSAKRGHNYITIFMDPGQKTVIFVTKGRDSSTWAECKKQLESHGGKADNITEVGMDMSPALKELKRTSQTQDKFHVIQAANEAVDEVRRKERKSSALLKNTRYLWLKNPENLSNAQKETMDKLKDCDLDTAKAYRMRLILQEIYRYPASIAPLVLQDWIQWGLRCRLDPMVEVAKMLQKHYDGVIRWFTSKLNNGRSV
ncbi:ISL3 family transposase [Paenibacillus melissococcoides]|uniref:ISL3 family transposase n=1 Tax=Paenibacillus melissococcoides TaxID=2912268 RepID=A0ABM9GA80_9BACL|nr:MULTISPECIES: ISL3 family transposase [Paenibacillus]MEB9894615.1 ISL3 family transposase [Bacillus cereus]CAH8248876.1 ISL3 family transposase [Paenibacillus melissococcoides]CAH8720667.1 ISL3 family transposase [Paenibacillus melissococcoides]CAH8720974.1 ISL3 family transposase [Paenibacillus melissococcoides]GIO79208.1 ISL3 family transposase ISMac21 [Paenibacillus dendritiformis]